ncbi:MAG: histone deacetylase family protein [Proteobacteria bacterium]|nr:histone deacetylase family protein [Pseudomonadota bacterium]
MPTFVYSHPSFARHETGIAHPERPDRLRAVMRALEAEPFQDLVRVEAPRATVEQVALVHPKEYVEAILEAVPEAGLVALDADTVISPGSGEAALHAVGAAVAAVDAVARGEARNAFCAVRPPGHHAERTRPMGFCLFNNVAIGALHARAAHGLGRVAVVDFDVHHGNGTQHAFERDANLFYASSHEYPLFPGTGARGERGVGNIVNVPLDPLSGSAEFRAAYGDEILPALDRFRPEFLLVSAGFDAHADDPLASLRLGVEDFAWVTRELLAVANRHAGGRVVSTLEGGYNLDALGRSAAAHVEALMTA